MPNYARVILMLRDQQSRSGRLLRAPIRQQTEQLESRNLLTAAPIEFGAVYTEQDLGSDASTDTIEISFVGGAEGTQLSRLEISSDKSPAGLSLADLLFDTDPGGLGSDLAFVAEISSRQGMITEQILVEDGSSKLVLLLDGFAAGDRLTLSVDVDEVQGYDASETDLALINEELDPIVSGAEFQGSILTAIFTAPHYFEAEGTAEFRNRYDDNFASTNLDLPLDDEFGQRDRTAGAIGQMTQAPLPSRISGRVYEDLNANLQREAEDLPIAGVELALYVRDGEDYAFTGHTATTAASGEFTFSEDLGLLPGTYQLRETQPTGYFSVGSTVGFVNGEQVGEVLNEDVLTEIYVPHGGSEGIEYNFAEARPASLRGRVHLSSPEGDCFSEGIDHWPIAGVRVELYDATNTLVAETVTDPNGQYEFPGLRPGEYTIVEITPQNLLDGGAQAGEINGERRGVAGDSRIAGIDLFSGERGDNYDFCEHEPARLAGHVYHDRNNDGERGPQEEGIASALLSLLDEQGSLVDSAETDASGRYEFVGVRAGNYRVVQMQPDGWLDGRDKAGNVNGSARGTALNPGDEISDVLLLWGDVGEDYDFGELKPSSLAGRVHLSTVDGDCFDVDEDLLEPVAGAVVQLLDTTGKVLASVATDAEGRYSFGDLLPGEYSVRELTPAELIDGGANAGLVDGQPRGSVNASGDIVGVRLDSDQNGTQYNFCEHEPATLAGFVYADDGNDGVRDAGEAPIAGAVVQLFDELGKVVGEAVTDANGQYSFTGIRPGTYAIRQIQPEGWIDGLDSAGTFSGQQRGSAVNPGDQIIDVHIGWGEDGEEYNFGELRPASLSGMVHASSEQDCWNDPDAVAIAGVRIWLLGSDGQTVAETVTDAAGRYAFEQLFPDEYTVRQEQPTAFFQGTQRAGTAGNGDASVADVISSITVSAGVQLVDYDFCEQPPSTLSGFVFQDGAPIPLEPDEVLPTYVEPYRDGQRSPDDKPLAGVMLELREGISGRVLDGSKALPGVYPPGPIWTVTDAEGYYEFTGLPSGGYAVYEHQPADYIDGVDTAGTTPGIAINPLPPGEVDIFLNTVVAMLSEPPPNDVIARIQLPPGVHSQFNNFSEVLTVVERLVPPPESPPLRPLPPLIQPEMPGLYTRFAPLGPAAEQPLEFPADGSESVRGSTWHLSIVDGGQPRMSRAESEPSLLFPASSWRSDALNEGRWQITLSTAEGMTSETFYFGLPEAIPVTGDFNGDGATEVGVFVKGHWFIDLNANGEWDANDLWAKLGDETDLPVTGDWDGDGKDDIGIFGRARPGDPQAIAHEAGLPDLENAPTGEKKNLPPPEDEATLQRRVMKRTASGELRADIIDHVFLYGTLVDQPVAGDWNGDGIDTPGVFRAGIWQLDVDGNGRRTDPDAYVEFGGPSDIPLVGDFNGDGIDELAIFRDGVVYIDANGNRQLDANDLKVERPADETGIPVVGKWSGQARDGIGWYHQVDGGTAVVARRPDN